MSTHHTYLKRAWQVALEHSDDPKARFDERAAVGALLIDKKGQIFESANQLPHAVRTKLHIPNQESSLRYHYLEHAERSVLFKAATEGGILADSTLYCTRFPCSDCARAIVAFGVAKLIVPETGLDQNGRWIEAQDAAKQLLNAADISVQLIVSGTPFSLK